MSMLINPYQFGVSGDAAILALSPTAWWDPSDLSTVFSDAAGTTPASVNGLVARVNDKSGNGNHLINSSGANKPTLRQSGGLYYLEFVNTVTWLDCTGISMSQPNDYCLGFSVSTTTFRVIYHGITTVQYMITQSGVPKLYAGTAAVGAGTISTSTATVLTNRYDGASSFIRKNGVSTSVASTPGSGGLLGLRIGADPSGGSPFPGNFYGMICRDAVFSAGELTTVESYMAGKSGVTL